jgi:SAM-dependent methyltransferase
MQAPSFAPPRPGQPDWLRLTTLPLAVRAFLASAHRRAMEGAQGRVLDLAPAGLGSHVGPAVRELLRPGAPSATGRGGGHDPSVEELLDDGPYDTIVSVLALAEVSDAYGRLLQIRRALRPDGRLALADPYRRTGWRGTLTSASAPFMAAWSGLHVDHPVPALVRAAGFAIVSVERKTATTLVPSLRSIVELTALRPAADGTDRVGGRP